MDAAAVRMVVGRPSVISKMVLDKQRAISGECVCSNLNCTGWVVKVRRYQHRKYSVRM